jgi:hypothetical protein
MSGSGDEENLSEGKKLLPVQFGQVGPDLDRVIVVPRQRDGLKFRLFILAGLFQDAGQTIMQRYQSAHAEWLSFLFLRNPFLELHCHPLEVVIGRIISIRRSHCHGCSGERSFVRYPLYAAGAGGFWITTLERHAANLCYFCTLCDLAAGPTPAKAKGMEDDWPVEVVVFFGHAPQSFDEATQSKRHSGLNAVPHSESCPEPLEREWVEGPVAIHGQPLSAPMAERVLAEFVPRRNR